MGAPRRYLDPRPKRRSTLRRDRRSRPPSARRTPTPGGSTTREVRPSRPRQRACCDGRGAQRTARRGHVHGLRHRGGAPRTARPASGARAGDQIVHAAVEHSAVLQAARWSARARVSSPWTPWAGSGSTTSTSPTPGSWRASPPTTRSPRSSPWPRSRGQPGTCRFVDACASPAGPLPEGWLPGRVRAPVGRATRRRLPSYAAGRGGETRSPRTSGRPSTAPASRRAGDPGRRRRPQAVVSEREAENVGARSSADPPGRGRPPGGRGGGHLVDRLPHLVTFSCLYVDGEALVRSWTGWASRWRADRPALFDPGTEPRARRDGCADPRQRRASRSTGTPRTTTSSAPR